MAILSWKKERKTTNSPCRPEKHLKIYINSNRKNVNRTLFKGMIVKSVHSSSAFLSLISVVYMIKNKYIFPALSLITVLCLSIIAITTVSAAEADLIDLPAISGADGDNIVVTHPIMRLTQDKSEMVKLDQEAASVIVGNPNHVSVLLDTPDTLVIVPRTAGASHFTVLGKDGSILMQRHVIVGAPKEQYIRIRRSCSPDDRGCRPTSVYFCPDMCHEVIENTQ